MRTNNTSPIHNNNETYDNNNTKDDYDNENNYTGEDGRYGGKDDNRYRGGDALLSFYRIHV